MSKIYSLYPPASMKLGLLDSRKYAHNQHKRLLKERRKKEKRNARSNRQYRIGSR